MDALARHPTIRRENASITKATYTMPRYVAIGEVGNPQLIRVRRGEVAVHQILRRVRGSVGDRRAHARPSHDDFPS